MKVTLYCQFSKLSVFKSDTGNEMSGRYSQSTTEIKSRKPGKYNQYTTEKSKMSGKHSQSTTETNSCTVGKHQHRHCQSTAMQAECWASTVSLRLCKQSVGQAPSVYGYASRVWGKHRQPTAMQAECGASTVRLQLERAQCMPICYHEFKKNTKQLLPIDC